MSGFYSGGIVINSSVSSATLSSGSIVASVSNFKNALNGLSEGFVTMDRQTNYCNSRRGGPRSKVFCEVPKEVPHEIHAGRPTTNSGRWYSWKDREEN